MPVVAAVIAVGAAVGGGITKANAARSAAKKQVQGGREAIASAEAAKEEALATNATALEQSRADLQPYADAGKTALPTLQSNLASLNTLVNDPNAQNDFIQNNPFFNSLAAKAKNDLFANQAARGKVGSGGTAEALQNSLVLLGSDLLNRDIAQKTGVNTQYQNLVDNGQNAATNQAGYTQNTARSDVGTITGTGQNVGNIQQGIGNVRASGAIAEGDARAGIFKDVGNIVGKLGMGGFAGASTANLGGASS